MPTKEHEAKDARYYVVDVLGDKNGFYRAVTVLMRLAENQYVEVKQLMGNFLLEHRAEYADIRELEQLAHRIKIEGEVASHECMRVAAGALRRTFVLHRDRYPAARPEIFVAPQGAPSELPHLHLLFRGSWQYGHF